MPETLVCEFTVVGHPEPAGSKKAMAITKKNASGKRVPVMRGGGTPMIAVVDANPNAAKWKAVVAEHAMKAMVTKAGEERRPPVTGPMRVSFVFYRSRPKNHYGTGRNSTILKSSSPEWPTSAPDALKLGRGVEDAMTGIVYEDDAQIVLESLEKRFGTTERVEIKVWSITP